MFEKTLEQMTASVYVSEKDKKVLDYSGLSYDFQIGQNHFNYNRAVALVEKMYRLYASVAKCYRKRYLTIVNQIIFAFGPEFESLHRKQPA